MTITHEDLICPSCNQQGILTCGTELPSKYQGVCVYAYCINCKEYFNTIDPPELMACQVCRKCDGMRYYDIDGERYPSVTSILDFLPKPEALKKWLGNPANAKKGKRSMVIGTLLHYKISNYYARKAGLPPVALDLHPGSPKPDKEMGETVNTMYSYFLQFDEEYKPEAYAVEHVICNKELGYAGTSDMVCKIGGSTWLLDWKTTSKFFPTMLPKDNYNAQLWAYKEAIGQMGRYKVEKMAIVYLSADGFAFARSDGDRDLFMKAMDIYKQGRTPPKKSDPKPQVIDTKRYWCEVFDAEVKNGKVAVSSAFGDFINCSECMLMGKDACEKRREMPSDK